MFSYDDLRSFKILTYETQPATSCSELRVTGAKVIFNKIAAAELGYPTHVNIFIGENFESIIVIPADNPFTNNLPKYAIPFYSGDEQITRTGQIKRRNTVEICNKSLARSIRLKRGWGANQTKKVSGIRYPKNVALYFDMTKAVDAKRGSTTKRRSTDLLLEELPTLEQAFMEMRPVMALPSGEMWENPVEEVI